MASDGDIYPFPTELAPDVRGWDGGGYSILLLSLRHRVHLRQSPVLGIGYGRRVLARQREWCQTIARFGWELHPILRGVHGASHRTRLFAPSLVLCKSAQDALLGSSRLGDAEENAAESLIRKRLDATDRDCAREEPVLLTLEGDDVPLYRRQLQVSAGAVGKAPHLGFQIDWADLWLFPDGHAMNSHSNAVLACRVTPIEVEEADGRTRAYRIGDLAVLNRLLRDLDLGDTGNARLRQGDDSGGKPYLWKEILRHWLGIEPRLDRRQVFVDSGAATRGDKNLLRLEPGDPIWADRHSDYVKVLTAARIETPSAQSGWGCPQVEPELSPARVASERSKGAWSPEQSAWVHADAAGCPSLGDALLYELASTTSEGASLGLDGSCGYQVSADYLRGLYAQSSIEIWEYWRGLALRDTCAFLAWHQEMPILRQAEERYYPLYLHTYYCQLRLHDLSEDIIEHELTDVQRAREIRRSFMQFRNQFWFQETAIGFQGIAVADAMRSGMGLEGLYNSVSSEIEEVGRYVDEQSSAARQQLVTLAVAMIYPVAFLWNLYKEPVEAQLKSIHQGWTLGVTVLGVLALTVFYLRFGQRITRRLGRLAAWVRSKAS